MKRESRILELVRHRTVGLRVVLGIPRGERGILSVVCVDQGEGGRGSTLPGQLWDVQLSVVRDTNLGVGVGR